MAHRITDYVNYTATELSGQVEASALNYAETIADASFSFSSDPWQLGKGYLATDNRKWRKKIGFMASYTTRSDKPIITLINQKTGERSTFTPSCTPSYTPKKRRQAPQTNIQTCPACGKHHDGKHPKCYYCYIDGLYQQALPPNNHPYLAKKGISLSLAMSIGMRRVGDKLIIPLTGGNGYQVITPHGKFTAVSDGMAGMYVPVGWLSPTRIYVCEGVATAVSAHLAINNGVVAALSTANLPHVVGHFRQKYPDAEIIILADNDAGSFFRKTADNPTGMENPGKTIAYEVAQKHGCLVSLPPTSHKADWNDYYLTHGDVATCNAINNGLITPTNEPTPPTEQQLKRRMALAGLSDDAISTLLAHNIPIKFIEAVPLRLETLGDIWGKSTMLLAGMMQGKTSIVAKGLAEMAGKAYVCTHLISLARNASKVLSLPLYLDLKSTVDKMVIVANSLQKHYQPQLDLFFVDEIEGLLKALADGSHISDSERTGIFNAFNQQANAADTAVYTAADIDALSISWWVENDKNPDKQFIINEATAIKGKKINLYADKRRALDNLKADMKANRKILIACDSKNFARLFGLNSDPVMAELLKGYKAQWISSENSSNPEIVDFLANISLGSYTEVDLLVFTPTIGEGVSMEKQHFEAHYFIGGGAIDVPKALQMIGRDRTAKLFHVYVPAVGIGASEPQPLHEYEYERLRAVRENFEAMEANIAPEYLEDFKALRNVGLRLSPLDHHIARAKHFYGKINHKYRHNLSNRAAAAGYDVQWINKKGETTFSEQMNAVKEARYDDIIAAHDIDDIQADALRNADGLTSEQQYQLERYNVQQSYNDVSMEILEQDNGGQGRKIIRKRAALSLSPRKMALLDLNDQLPKALYQRKNGLIEQQFYRVVLDATGIQVDNGQFNYENARYSKHDDYSGVATYLENNIDVLNVSVPGLTRLTTKRIAKPHLVVAEALRLIGVAKQRTNCRKTGNYYTLHDKYEGLLDYGVAKGLEKSQARYEFLENMENCVQFLSCGYNNQQKLHTQPQPKELNSECDHNEANVTLDSAGYSAYCDDCGCWFAL